VQRKRVHFTRVKRRITRVRVIMAFANCSPSVASRRAKYVDEIRVPKHLVAQPRSRKKKNSSRRETLFPMALQDYTQLFQRGGWQSPVTQIPQISFWLSSDIF
jgi:hypothetical protein